MIRSMSTALSGLRNHQVMIDIVGNDIADTLTSSAAGDRLAVAGSMIGREITFGASGRVSTAIVDSVRVDGDTLVLRTTLGDVPIDAVTGIRPGSVD